MASLVFLICVLLLVPSSQAKVKLSISDSGEMSSGKAFNLACYVVEGVYSKHDPYVWRKNDEVLPGETGTVLQFAALDRADMGMYDCGYNDAGTMYYSGKFEVSFSYRPVVHISVSVKDHDDRFVPAGYDVYLTCNVTDSSPPVLADDYLWWRSKSCQDTAMFTLEQPKNPSVFKLLSVKITDEGCYRCMAMNTDQLHNNASKMLHVSYLDYPCISLDPAVMEGDSTKVNCSVNSSPKATLALYKDGIELPSALASVEVLGLLSYNIPKVTLELRGSYECRASNKDINASKSVTAEFKIRHKPVARGNSSYVNSVKSPIGATVKLTVEFEANPQPTVEWRRVSPDRVTFHSAVTTHNSSVLTVRVEDTPAVFSVRISNEYGELSRQFEVEGVADTGTNLPTVQGETTTTAPGVAVAGTNPQTVQGETTTTAPGVADAGTTPLADRGETTTTAPVGRDAAGCCADSFQDGLDRGIGFGIVIGIVIGLVISLVVLLGYQRCQKEEDPAAAGQGNEVVMEPLNPTPEVQTTDQRN